MEIGSEFWLDDFYKNKTVEENVQSNEMYFLSGRTAIDYAIDILENKKINSVYFPSYCCASMLQPFLERKIKVEFYKVYFKDGDIVYDIDCNKACDIFFAMNYFGFNKYNMDFYINKFKQRNVYIIEDSTHSWLSNRKYNTNSDLVVASLRKWFPIISGAILINKMKVSNCESKKEKLKDNKTYIKLKEEAMFEKYKYICNEGTINKDDFLKKYYNANKILEKDYKKYKMDDKSYNILKSINIEEIITRRKQNVKEIYNFLTNQNEIQYLKSINLKDDCPIFVPIFLEEPYKKKLKKYLIDNNVYCPNHWNIPMQIKNIHEKEIYERELSLVCDQRYDKIDIKKYINLINIKELK